MSLNIINTMADAMQLQHSKVIYLAYWSLHVEMQY